MIFAYINIYKLHNLEYAGWTASSMITSNKIENLFV